MAASKAKSEAPATFRALRRAHPDAHCELDHEGAFQLIVATIMSAQTTDVNVNRVTPPLFERWPTAEALARAPIAEVETTIAHIGMFRQKAKNITRMAQLLVERHGGEVPRTLAELVELPGVGRKTANVVLGVAFGAPEGVVVDTHVQRISQRLGWTKNTTPEKIEQDLMKLFPQKDWDMLSHTLIFHGRRVCDARRPACAACSVTDSCPSAFKAENVGRKPPKARGNIAPAEKNVGKASSQKTTKGAAKAAKKAPAKAAKKAPAKPKEKLAKRLTKKAPAKR
jgi:endonuclease-3